MRQEYLVAVDGGQTATKCLVATTRGRILGRGRGPASGSLLSPEKRSRLFSSVQTAIETALTAAFAGGEIPRLRAVCCGMTGLSADDPGIQAFYDGVRDMVPVDDVWVEWDGFSALRGATGGEAGLMVLSGGGAVAVGVDRQGHRERTGGWGHTFGDLGSGFDIGRQAVVSACRAADGMLPATILGDAVCKHFGVQSLREIKGLRDADQLDDGQLAGLVPVVKQAAEAGDARAFRLLQGAGEELALLAAAVARRLPDLRPLPVYPTGGVFQVGALILEPFQAALQGEIPSAQVHPPRYDPLVGTLLFGFEQLGIPITAEVKANLDATVSL